MLNRGDSPQFKDLRNGISTTPGSASGLHGLVAADTRPAVPNESAEKLFPRSFLFQSGLQPFRAVVPRVLRREPAANERDFGRLTQHPSSKMMRQTRSGAIRDGSGWELLARQPSV
jgi:hypothetical protein